MIHLKDNILAICRQRNLAVEEVEKACGLKIEQLGGHQPLLPQVAWKALLDIASLLNYPAERLLRDDLKNLEEKIKSFNFKFLALDIDGVLTEGGMFYTQSGDEFKRFDAKDGMVIKALTAAGQQVAFISSGINDHIVNKRAAFLGVQYVYAGTKKKQPILEQWMQEMKISYENLAYVGDDVNDLEIMKMAGLSACPADAAPQVKSIAHIILSKPGGKGCVREFIEYYLLPESWYS